MYIHPHPPTLSRQHASRTLAGSPAPATCFPRGQNEEGPVGFSSRPTSSSRCLKTKQLLGVTAPRVPGRRRESGRRVGAGANGAPPGEHHADVVGWSAGDSSGLCEAARFAPLHLSGCEGRAILPPAAAGPTIPLPPYKICPPLLATFPMLRFSSHSPWAPRAHIV